MHELRYIEIRKFLDSKNTPALEPALNLEKKKKTWIIVALTKNQKKNITE